MSIIAAAAGLAAFCLPALAGDKAKDVDVDPRIGEEVNSICFTRSIDNFRTLDDVDDAVLLEKGVNDWFYVELLGACNASRLRFAQSVAIDSRPSGGCLRKGDTLIFSDSITFADRTSSSLDFTRCTITDIYKWDEDAGKEDASDAE